MTQQVTRHARRVYVGGLPPTANQQSVATFFSHVMSAIGGNTAGPGDAVVNVYINHEKKFAFVEMRSVEEASNAMALDGIIFMGAPVKVRRPSEYNPSLAATLGPTQPNTNLNLAAVGLTSGSALLPNTAAAVAGLLPGVSPTLPGMFPNILPLPGGQFGALPAMPVDAMIQQAARHALRVYVGGLPPTANEQSVATFFSHVMSAIGGNTAGPGDAVVNVYINHEKKFAFVEMRSVEEASNAMALDGIIFEGAPVKVRRPSSYNPSLAATLGPTQPNTTLNLAAVGLTSGSALLPNTAAAVAGLLPGVSPTLPGMFPNILPLPGGQFGALPPMPVHAMIQQAARHALRVYVGGLPPTANEQSVATFFSHVMSAIGGNTAGPGDAVVNVYINHEKKFAFVEMRSVEEASNAMALDGIIFEGAAVKVRRPSDYNPSLAATLGPTQPNPNLNLASLCFLFSKL